MKFSIGALQKILANLIFIHGD